MAGAWVYILKCADGSYYTGLTRGDPEKRLSEHELKLSSKSYTAARLPLTVEYTAHYELVADAIAAERQIKGWSRTKKDALIKGDWSGLKTAAKRRGGNQ